MKGTLVLPFLDTLGNAEKEAMAGILYEVMRFKNKKPGDRIYHYEFVETVERMFNENRLPTVFRRQYQNCWNAVWEMADEGLLLIHDKKPGEDEDSWMIVTDDLAILISPDTSDEVKLRILSQAEINKSKAKERKAAEEEEKKIQAEKERKEKSIFHKIGKYIPFLK